VQATGASTQSSDQALSRQLGGFIGYVMQTYGRDVVQLAADFEISLSQMKALQTLRNCPEPMSVKELGDRLGLSLAAMSRSADGLVQRGLVDRAEDPVDRRMKRLHPTEAGYDLAQKMIEARVAGIEEFVGSLSSKERTLLAKALDPIMDRADVAAFRGGVR
jgi:DNA-binding MarR family transcriptional regulator